MTHAATVSRRLPQIDGLRALAALAIFGYHALFVTGQLHPGSYGWFLNAGVPLFYGISGFLLFMPWARRAAAGGPGPDPGPYLRRRVTRIVPAYWIALPIVAILLARGEEVFSPSGVVTYFGFLQMYRLQTFTGGIGQAWTLGVEVAFYLFLPLYGLLHLAVTRNSRTGQLLSVGMLAALSLGWKVAIVTIWGSGSLVALLVLPAALDQFAAGMLVAVLLACEEAGVAGSAVLAACRRRPWLPVCGGVAVFLLLGLVGPGVSPLSSLPGSLIISGGAGIIAEHELKALLALLLLLAAVCSTPGKGAVGRLVGARAVRGIGTTSYGFYLWHLSVLVIIAGAAAMGPHVKWFGGSEGLIGGAPGVAVAFAVSILLGVVSWRFVERPLVMWSHRDERGPRAAGDNEG